MWCWKLLLEGAHGGPWSLPQHLACLPIYLILPSCLSTQPRRSRPPNTQPSAAAHAKEPGRASQINENIGRQTLPRLKQWPLSLR